MAEDNWVFVERFGGQMRRVTVLDETFQVLATHERDGAPADGEQHECQLLRAVELERPD